MDESLLSWQHSPARHGTPTRRALTSRGSKGSPALSTIRTKVVDRANQLLLSYVKMGLAEQVERQQRKMEKEALPISAEAEEAMADIPSSHEWRSRAPMQVASPDVTAEVEILDEQADVLRWRVKGKWHIGHITDDAAKDVSDSQRKMDIGELHERVASLDMWTIPLIFRGQEATMDVDASTPFRAIHKAVQVAFGLQAEQQLLYLRKADGRLIPAGLARQVKALAPLNIPRLSHVQQAKAKATPVSGALVRSAATRAARARATRNDFGGAGGGGGGSGALHTDEINAKIRGVEWMLAADLSTVLKGGRFRPGPVGGLWPKLSTPTVSPPNISPPGSPDGENGLASLGGGTRREMRVRDPISNAGRRGGRLKEGARQGDVVELEARRRKDPTYKATPLIHTHRKVISDLGIEPGDAITIGVDPEATKRIQRQAINQQLGDPKHFDMRTEEAFKRFDLDGGGTIEADELQMTMESIGLRLSEVEVAELVEKYDEDGDAQFDLGEFRAMVKDMIHEDTPGTESGSATRTQSSEGHFNG